MKTTLGLLLPLLLLTVVWSCASAPTGPSEPGRPWISKAQCPYNIKVGEMGKMVFLYQGDELPAYAEVTLFKISGMGGGSDLTAPVNYLYENQYEIPLQLSKNPATWGITFYVVDAKGRFSNELSCQMTVR